jgi:hypothetical protein
MTITTTPLREAADRLIAAAAAPRQCNPVRDILGANDIAAAYAVQQLLTEHSLSQGRRIVGHKIGLTSPAVQRQLGVEQPDSGVLFADMRVAEGDTVAAGKLLQPRVEAEIAFILADDLDGAVTTVDGRHRAIQQRVNRLTGRKSGITVPHRAAPTVAHVNIVARGAPNDCNIALPRRNTFRAGMRGAGLTYIASPRPR